MLSVEISTELILSIDIHIPLSNPNIDVRILAQGYCGCRLFLYGKGGWVLPCINHIYIVCAVPKAMVFAPFRSENGNKLVPDFDLESSTVLKETTAV